MIKVISPAQIQTKKCEHCKAVLEYDHEDIRISQKKDFVCKITEIIKYINCPCCRTKLILDRRYYDWE